MKNIIITGGLGYIGTELCKIYQGQLRRYNITVLDKKFHPQRVSEIKKSGFKFINADITEDDIAAKYIPQADIIIHLSGITDVPSVKKDENEKIKKEINLNGELASKNIIKYAKKDSKIIFPSTHVVFEGLSETEFEITETFETMPNLAYSKSKVQTENDLIESGLNYIILRLGSVVGYSGESTRINIMPNLFAKITSENGVINLFSGGLQHKSLVTVFDVARLMYFMGENNDINREIYHAASENLTVKQVAEICKEIKPELKIKSTNDEIPNLGYTISNKKLLGTGFEFLYSVKESIEEMIKVWEFKESSIDIETIRIGTDNYIDDRGIISNFHLEEKINLVGYIESKKGSIRGNHYHPVQEQKVLLVSGKYISVIKDLNGNNKIETNIINSGELVTTYPNVVHTMIFLEDSVFLNLVNGEREHKNYGSTHTIPYELVNSSLGNDFLKFFKSRCRVCDSEKLKSFISLGLVPLANNLIKNLEDDVSLFPLEIYYCLDCSNCQLSFVVPPDVLFDKYLYLSSTSKVFKEHFTKAARQIVNDFSLNRNSFVVDIGSNDGVFLQPISKEGIKCLGIEPAKNVYEIAKSDGIETINSYLNIETVEKIKNNYSLADVVTAFNVFAHVDDIKDFVKNSFELLTHGGVFIFEVQYIVDTIKDLTFDNIYHEHVNYWSVTSLDFFFDSMDLCLFKVETINTHGGSIRGYVSRKNVFKKEKSVKHFLENEIKFGIDKLSTYEKFNADIKELRTKTLDRLLKIKNNNNKIVGYGAPAKATTLLNYYGIDNKIIDFIVEDNPLKHNHFVPGVDIPINSKELIPESQPDYILVLAWNFYEDIVQSNEGYKEMGSKFINIRD